MERCLPPLLKVFLSALLGKGLQKVCSQFRLVVPPGVSIAVSALQKRPIWSIIILLE